MTPLKRNSCSPVWPLLAMLLGVSAVAVEPLERAVELAPRSNQESCLRLAGDDLLEISFSASDAVDFNIHYHVDGQVRFPVNLKQQRDYADSYVAPEPREYCLMWTNRGPQSVRLSYEYRTRSTIQR